MNHRILLVDDDALLIEASSILLGLDGHDCRVATDGRRALEQARSFDPDIVILDIGLPGMSGYEIARVLRATSNGRPLHLAAVTGHSDPEDIERAHAAGFDQHVAKPIDAASLRMIVKTAESAGVAPT